MNSNHRMSSLSELVQQNRTPFYCYNKRVIRDSIAAIKAAFPIDNFQLLFATMANDNPEFLTTVRMQEVGTCVNSINHLRLVRGCGFSSSSVQFTSTGLSIDDLRLLQEDNITVNLDSITQLKNWLSLKPGLVAGMRINTSSLTDKVPVRDRLGIDKNELKHALTTARDLGGRINGLHIYVGTNYRNYVEMLPAVEAFFTVARTIPDIEYVNIGGGVGIDYMQDGEEFDLTSYGKVVSGFVADLRATSGRNVKLVFEPGRSLAAPSGMFVTRVTDIKELNSIRYVVVDGSIAVFPRPFHHPETPHRVFLPFKNNTNDGRQSIVVGKTTFSKDVMSICKLPANIEIGDVLLFDQAGAYCDSMRSRFLGQLEPQNIFFDE